MSVASYIENISKRYALGNATEHTFRGDLQQLIEEIVPGIAATNEPKRIACGAPDYVITRKDIPVGYIEAKDVGVDLDGKNLKEQFDRYLNALDNLVFTDYLDFRFYFNGQPTTSIKIAEIQNGKIVPITANFEQFTSLIKEFCERKSITIKSAKTLAEMMADKAKILAFIIKTALEKDIADGVESDLTSQMKAFKDILIHDIDAKAFADIYAQTIAYGMFAARLHDPSLETFSRKEAAELIPKTNPFLRKLFQFIAAYDLDTRIDWIVDALADLFRATDIAAILKNFGKSTQTHDPIMHFYETFLAEYDPKLRKSRGVFYTPEPVVDFIVRAVDDILKTEFGLPQGLADTSKTKIKVKTTVRDERMTSGFKEEEKEVHKVQILDPATGTGTFLATVIKQIYKGFQNQQGVWNQYVDEHLLPRLNGFELLMASYAMAHLKLDLLLGELSKEFTTENTESTENLNNSVSSVNSVVNKTIRDQRFQVYLTNALEEYHPDTGTLFASWLSTEANEANHIKRDTPVMVVIGNPPYAVSSSNRSVNEDGTKTWIGELLDDYKKNLNERKLNIDDDYIKFVRLGHHLIEKTGHGILAYISNNSYLDGITHREMRRLLATDFDKIYLVDLHGNSKKLESAPDGSKDENVFDIMQGVSIGIFVKTEKRKTNSLARIFHADVFGKREDKYSFLTNHSLSSVAWNEVPYQSPNYFYSPKELGGVDGYYASIGVGELFLNKNTGIQTKNDPLTIQFTSDELERVESDFLALDASELERKYGRKDGTWQYGTAKKDLVTGKYYRTTILVKPFDVQYTILNQVSSGFLGRPRFDTMRHMLSGSNLALLVSRQNKSQTIDSFFITNTMSEMKAAERSIQSYHFPLYVYPKDENQFSLDGKQARIPNLNSEIVDKIADAISLTFTNEKEETDGTFAPIDILDYIYAVLHSPSYREKYKEFLKIDFPRVPYPKDAATFWQLVSLGGELRQIHLLESPTVSKFITGFPVGGDNTVEKIAFLTQETPEMQKPAREQGRNTQLEGNALADARASATTSVGDVYFNETQYFSNVPEIAWNFYIGGYQPAQKWLKDRKGRKLSFEDIQHYQKIIVALTETDRIMKEINEIDLID